jgi:hypothetical protein
MRFVPHPREVDDVIDVCFFVGLGLRRHFARRARAGLKRAVLMASGVNQFAIAEQKSPYDAVLQAKTLVRQSAQ